jgi:hypothetical protein
MGSGLKHWVMFHGPSGSGHLYQIDGRLTLENMKREGMQAAKNRRFSHPVGCFTIERGAKANRTFALCLPVHFDFSNEVVEGFEV